MVELTSVKTLTEIARSAWLIETGSSAFGHIPCRYTTGQEMRRTREVLGFLRMIAARGGL